MNCPQILIATFVLLLVGCGRNGDRLAIQGNVTLDGQPLPQGQIVFLPQTGTQGPSAGSSIEDGAYSVPASKGTFPGIFRVEITAERKTGRKIHGPLGETVDQVMNYIPARYNQMSELSVDVQTDGDNEFSFALESKSK